MGTTISRKILKLNYQLIFIFFLPIFYSNVNGQSMVKSYRNWIKFGIDFGISYFNPKDVNSLIDNWYSSIGITVKNEISKSIHLGLSGTGYISFIPFEYFEIRPQYEYFKLPVFLQILY